MSSPAERYAASRRRSQYPVLGEFAAGYAFPLDAFQLRACEAVEDGRGVLVCAPTGAGKTVVGEFAVFLALRMGQKCFYTTPIKALSNQKFADLVAVHGPDAVGLLTGDTSINSNAPIVVMTTEVLRNMLYAGSETLRGLGYVVMDEVHYLSDQFRGAVWEEVIIHLPDAVRLVSLSATVSNAEEFADWLVTVRGDTTVIVEEHRPVPLWQHVYAEHRLYDLFVDQGHQQLNPELVRLGREEQRFSRGRDGRGRGPRGRGYGRPRRVGLPSRVEVISRLDTEGLLPAITFIFSRAGCDAAALQCLRSGLRLTTPEQRRTIREYVEARTADLPPEDLAVLGYDEWLEGLVRGIAAHHAGMLPTFKEVVEELFSRGLVKAVFATETLALGVNMPARSVVLERLVKWNGETHADITPGEYTQLTGRAGRRGIDVEGHAIVVWSPGFDPASVAGLASARTYPLRSSFRPSYNMAVNLVGWVGRDRARALLESSFAQFQADRGVVGLARQLKRNEEALEGYREAMTCHLGDFEEYSNLRRALSDREAELARNRSSQRRREAVATLERLRSGDVIRVPAGRRAGFAVVLDPGIGGGDEGPRPVVLTAERQVKRLSLVDFPAPVEPVTRLRVPRNFNGRSPQSRRDLASSLRNALAAAGVRDNDARAGRPGGRSSAADDDELRRLRAALRAHPCHGCAEREEHARWAERWQRLRRETSQLTRRVEGRTNTLARTFDRVCGVLDDLGYLKGDAVTDPGRQLSRVYSELDLLVVECLRHGAWDGLSPAELASCVSALVYESRQPDQDGAAPPRLPGGQVREALAETVRLWGGLSELEEQHRVGFLREPDLGFAWLTFRWASGRRLDEVIGDGQVSAGNFVRWTKQLLDLLDQIATAANDAPIARTARAAIETLRRGVVAYSSVG